MISFGYVSSQKYFSVHRSALPLKIQNFGPPQKYETVNGTLKRFFFHQNCHISSDFIFSAALECSF